MAADRPLGQVGADPMLYGLDALYRLYENVRRLGLPRVPEGERMDDLRDVLAADVDLAKPILASAATDRPRRRE